jgi:hypothetical protein
MYFMVQDRLTKENIAEPMRDIRRALLEADVCVISCITRLSCVSAFLFLIFRHNLMQTYFAGKCASSKKFYRVRY